MRLIIEGNALFPPRTGIGHYTYELIRAIEKHPSFESVHVLLLGHILITSSEALEMSSGKLAFEDVSKVAVGPSPIEKAIYKIVRLPILKSFLKKREDIFYKYYRYTCAFLPGWLTKTSRYRIASETARDIKVLMSSPSPVIYHSPNFYSDNYFGTTILTVHDLSMHRVPETHTAERVREIKEGLEKALSIASKVIVVSEFTKRELMAVYKTPSEKIEVIPLAASSAFRPFEEAEVDDVLRSVELTFRGYALFVGTIEPRKNLSRLLDAWEGLPRDLTAKTPLLIVGASGWENSDIKTKLERLEAQRLVRTLGFVPANKLPQIVGGAKCSIYPSLYEGFGLPVIEAMASGVPVLTSDRTALPEVAGGAALLVNPESVCDLKVAIERLMTDRSLRTELAEKGLARARQFSWERCAEQTIGVYQQSRHSNNSEIS